MAVENLVRQPLQDRSQRTMERVLDAFEHLLEQRPYERITIADIAQESQTGTSSIYARFKDKRAILVALHERVRVRALEHFENVYEPDRWSEVPVADALRQMIAQTQGWYREHHNVIKASILLNDDVIFNRISNSLHGGSRNLSFFIQDRVEGFSRRQAIVAAEMVFRIIIATFQQIAIFDTVEITKEPVSDEEIVAGLLRATLAQLYPERLAGPS